LVSGPSRGGNRRDSSARNFRLRDKIFDATNLTRVVYSLPSTVDTFDGAGENAFALDTERGLMATKNYVYELERYEIVVPTLETNADLTCNRLEQFTSPCAA
jgi:hypothetical protein